MADRPNILIFLPDQHRGDFLPYSNAVLDQLGMNSLPLELPTIRKLMAGGVTFSRAVTPSPLCGPARACLATGRRYPAHGVGDNAKQIPGGVPTYFKNLREAGYEVGTVGKLDLRKGTRFWGINGFTDDHRELGFTRAVDQPGKAQVHKCYLEWPGEPRDPYSRYLYDHGLMETYAHEMSLVRGDGVEAKLSAIPTRLPDEAYADNFEAARALDMLESFPTDKPWHLVVNYSGPHPPWNATESMLSRTRDLDFGQPVGEAAFDSGALTKVRRAYAAAIENIDGLCGRIVDCVAGRGDFENTVVIYTSDHGEMLGDHGKLGKRHPERGSVHIPLVIAGPGVRKGVVSRALVELQDVAATSLDFAGAPSLEGGEDSRSLKALLCGEMADGSLRDFQVSAYGEWRMGFDGRYKLIAETGGAERLYDLENDPWELDNLVGKMPDRAGRIRDRLFLKEDREVFP